MKKKKVMLQSGKLKSFHTPTPWKIEKDEAGCACLVARIGEVSELEVASHMQIKDAEFVQCAVNSHEELLAVLKAMRDCASMEEAAQEKLFERAERAIAQAEKGV